MPHAQCPLLDVNVSWLLHSIAAARAHAAHRGGAGSRHMLVFTIALWAPSKQLFEILGINRSNHRIEQVRNMSSAGLNFTLLTKCARATS